MANRSPFGHCLVIISHRPDCHDDQTIQMTDQCRVLALVPRTTDRSRPRSLSRRHAVPSRRARRLPTRDVCRARSSTRRGRWRAGCGGFFAAGASSIWAADMACSRQLMLLLDDSSSDGARRRQDVATVEREAARARCSRPGRACPDASRFVAAGIEEVEILPAPTWSSRAMPAAGSRIWSSNAPPPRGHVSPCCRAVTISPPAMTGTLSGWVDGPSPSTSCGRIASRAAGLSHLDADHSYHDHAEEPPVAWRARSTVESQT